MEKKVKKIKEKNPEKTKNIKLAGRGGACL